MSQEKLNIRVDKIIKTDELRHILYEEVSEEDVDIGVVSGVDAYFLTRFFNVWCRRIDNLVKLDKMLHKGRYSAYGHELLHSRGFTRKEYVDLFNSAITESEFYKYPVYQQLNRNEKGKGGILTETQRQRFISYYKLTPDEDGYIAALQVSGVIQKLSFFLEKNLPYYIKLKHRFAHIIATAKSGSGKSVLMMHDVWKVIKNYSHFGAVLIIDPPGTFARTVYKFKVNSNPQKVTFFAPGYFGHDKLPSFNVFDIAKKGKGKQGLDIFEINQITDTIVSAIADVQESSETSGNIEKVLQKCVQFFLARESYSTLVDLQNLLILKPNILKEAQNYDRYFGDEFIKVDKQSREAVIRRVSKIIPDRLSEVLLTQESTIDLEKCMNTPGMVTIFEFSKLGPITRSAIGKFLVANILGNSLKRNPEKHVPLFCYFDEAHTISAGSLEYLLTQARKFGVSIFLASQYLSQFGAQSDAVRLSTAVQIAYAEYADQLSPLIRVPKKFLKNKQNPDNDNISNGQVDIKLFEFFIKSPDRDVQKISGSSFLLRSNKYFMDAEEQASVDKYQIERYYRDVDSGKISVEQRGKDIEERIEVVYEEEYYEKEGTKYFRNAPVNLPGLSSESGVQPTKES